MKYFAAIAAFACLAFTNAQTMPPFTNCAAAATDLTVNNFTMAPYPLCAGEEVCFTATGTLSAPIIISESATLSITGRYLGRVIYTDRDRDLCELMAGQGHPCPVPTTLTSITACVLVKVGIIRNIPIALTVQAINGSGNVLFCQSASGVIAKDCTV
ncbi:hypothetical protein BGZ51_002052 [Haplosporangium sp. Z 767]|nr:hypothetical protein BGZ50_004966 [Haplosporangium sp. Z 11]KAF9186358.1 hypothetical protein BGZ51_002052 [Haplosporangium sp. Z 767]